MIFISNFAILPNPAKYIASSVF